MPDKEQSVNSSAWSTTRRNILSEQKDIGTNKVIQTDPSTGATHQKLEEVPVYSDTQKIPLPVYEIDINSVSYNFQNVRLWKYKKKKCVELGIDPNGGLDSENDVHQKIIQNLLLNTKNYSTEATADLKEKLLQNGQEDPAFITEEGVLWNGNRRCAVMKDIHEHPPSGGTPDGRWTRIKVCFLPEGLTATQLRDLEKRLQQKVDTKEEYGRLNEMGEIHDYVENHDFENPEGYENPTIDEKREIVAEYHGTQWNTWNKIIQSKKIIDLLDEYLNSRDTTAIPLVGDYDFVESSPSGLAWWDDVVTLLRVVAEYYENHDGDPDEKVEAYKALCFASYDVGVTKRAWDTIRKLRNTLEDADGSGSPKDSTRLLQAIESESTIISDWGELSQNPEALIRNNELGENAKQILETNQRSMLQLGNDPKRILNEVINDITNIDQNLVLQNDQKLIELIQKCREKLQELQDFVEKTS